MFKDSIKKLYKKFMKKSYKLFFNREYKYLTVSPKPSDEEIEKYYLSEFYNNAHKDNKKGLPDSSLIKQKKDKEFHEIRFKDMYNNIKEIKVKIKKSSILDIGCGYGEFLSYMKKQKLDCYGLELSEDAIDYIKKFKKGIKIKIAQSSFPLEMFLLFGDNYIRDKKMGPLCHDKRFQFEKNLIKTGNYDLMKRLYRSLAELGLGRQICIYAKKQ